MLTERGQNNQLKEKATRFKIDLMTHKELLKGSMSTQNFSLKISSAYDKLRTELEELVEKWAQFIRMAVIVKDPEKRN